MQTLTQALHSMEVTLIIRTVPCLQPQLAAGVPLLGACVQWLNHSSSTTRRYVEGESEQEMEAKAIYIECRASSLT